LLEKALIEQVMAGRQATNLCNLKVLGP
jgi:hypothetical protein